MSFFPKEFLNSVVSISQQIKTLDQEGTEKLIYNIIGTGFLFGKVQSDGKYSVYLVTNKHVVKNQTGELYVSIRKKDGTFQKIKLLTSENGKSLFFYHSKDAIDIAVTRFTNIGFIQEEQIYFFQSDKNTYSKSLLISNNIGEGDGVFVFGYPASLTGNSEFPVVRQGIIAQIKPYYENSKTDYIIDAFTFPGNSGGPIFIKPEIYSVGKTSINNESRLIGILKSYIPYRESLQSTQTGNILSIHETNSGLTLVEGVDSIIETIEQCELINPLI
ncbi:MAG: serine protease [Candidatus Gracilibacteria bacterium]|nr:serine protease [Candidatus Gracilibacteria bacterium]